MEIKTVGGLTTEEETRPQIVKKLNIAQSFLCILLMFGYSQP